MNVSKGSSHKIASRFCKLLRPENSELNCVYLHQTIVRPFTILFLLLLFGFGEQKPDALGGEERVGNPMFGVHGEEVLARGGIKEGEVPLTLEKAAGHYEKFFGGMECQSFHEALAAFPFMGLIELLAIAPVKSEPALDAVACHGIAHWPHATNIEFLAVRVKGNREKAAEKMMALYNAPTGEVVGRPSRDLLAREEVPHANLTHQVSGGQIFAIGGKCDCLDRG